MSSAATNIKQSQPYAANGRLAPFPLRLRLHSTVAAVLRRYEALIFGAEAIRVNLHE